MIKISPKVKFDLYKYLSKHLAFWGDHNIEINLLEFLNDIWPLKTMPSSDGRFNNAYDDIIQHIINNNDWTIDYLFEDRLKLLEGDEHFPKFIETILNPKYRKGPPLVLVCSQACG